MRTKNQAGVYEEIPREWIRGAAYNPRKITDYARSLLKGKIESVGCVTPLVWNRRTGTLVSGHQRLSVLDDLEQTRDYRVGVMAIDVDEKAEREINIAMNNPQTQGDFDKDSFLKLLTEGGVDIADCGMTRIDLEFEFGDLPEIAGIFARESAAVADLIGSMQELRHDGVPQKEHARVQDITRKAKASLASKAQDDAAYYAVVVFDKGELRKWLRKNNFHDDTKFLQIGQVKHLIRKKEKPA